MTPDESCVPDFGSPAELDEDDDTEDMDDVRLW